MGTIQGAINSMIGTTGNALSVAKGIKTAKETKVVLEKSLQEQMAEKARKSAMDEIDFKIKQEELKKARAETRKSRFEARAAKGGMK